MNVAIESRDEEGNPVTNIEAGDIARLGYRVGDIVTVEIAGREVNLPFATTVG